MVMVLWAHLVTSDSCSSMNCSPSGFSLHNIFQAKILDWVAISSSRGSSRLQGWNLHLSVFLALQADSLPAKPSHKWQYYPFNCLSHKLMNQSYFLLFLHPICVYLCYSLSPVWFFVTPWTIRLLSPWNSPGEDIGVGSHFLFQGIFLTQGLTLGLLNCGKFLYHLSHKRSPSHISACSVQTRVLSLGWEDPLKKGMAIPYIQWIKKVLSILHS